MRLLLNAWTLAALAVAVSSAAWSQTGRSSLSDRSALFDDPVNRALGRQHYEDMWSFLATSETPWIRASAALHFIDDFVIEKEPEVRADGERLLAAIIASKPRDTHTLWLLLDACDISPEIAGCASSDMANGLIESATDNAAVYLKAVGIGLRSAMNELVEDNAESRQALMKASQAPVVDIYHGRDALQVYRELKVFEEKQRPTHEPALDRLPWYRALSDVWFVYSMRPIFSFGGLPQLCEAQVQQDRGEYVDACLTLARKMQSSGKSLLTKSMGYVLERKVLDALGEDEATVLYVYRKQRMLHEVLGCQLSAAARAGREPWPDFDESDGLAFWSDYATLGEVAAFRNQAIRGFEANPEGYEQDPRLCDLLMDLDSEAMGVMLGPADPGRLMESG